MATVTEWEPVSDDLWHALGYELPEACRVHHCWADQCPAGSHDETSDADAEGGVA